MELRSNFQGFDSLAIASAHETVERDEHGRVKAPGLRFAVRRLEPLPQWRHTALRRNGREAAVFRRRRRDPSDKRPCSGTARDRAICPGRKPQQLAHDIGAKLVIPCHFEMFEFNTATPDAFANTCRTLGQAFRILRLWRTIRLFLAKIF